MIHVTRTGPSAIDRGRLATTTSAASIALAFVLGGCAPAADATITGVFVTSAREAETDDEVAIAIVVGGGEATALVCGDGPDRERYPAWFGGATLANGDIDLARDGWSLVGTVGPASAGVVTEANGAELPWTAARDGGRGLTGLYTARDGDGSAGVVVLDDPKADAPLVRGAWFGAHGEVLQVVPIRPIELVDGAIAVEVPLATARRLEVRALAAPDSRLR